MNTASVLLAGRRGWLGRAGDAASVAAGLLSAVMGAGSLLELLPHSEREAKVFHPFATLGKVGELVAGVAVHHDASRVEVVERPLKQGLSGRLWKASKLCSAASLVLGVWPGRRRWTKVAGALLGTAGAVLTRFAVFHAGNASASEPQATFQPQRQG